MVMIDGKIAPTVGGDAPAAPPPPKLIGPGPDRAFDAKRWEVVIPPMLAAVLGEDHEAVVAHRELFERVVAAEQRVHEAARAHDRAVDADRRAEQAWAQGGRVKLPAARGATAEGELQQARRELDTLTAEIVPSAKRLLGAALEYVAEAERQLEQRLDEDDARVEQLIGEALALLDERAARAMEGRWLHSALWDSSVGPFDPSPRAASGHAAAELRQTLASLRHERAEAAERRFRRRVEEEMFFIAPRVPRPADGRSRDERRREAEQRVRERMAS